MVWAEIGDGFERGLGGDWMGIADVVTDSVGVSAALYASVLGWQAGGEDFFKYDQWLLLAVFFLAPNLLSILLTNS